MTTYERITEIKNTVELTMENAHETYSKTEAELVSLLVDQLKDTEVDCSTFGTGTVIQSCGETLEDMFIDISFGETTKSFSLKHAMTNTFVKFADADVNEALNAAYELHADLTANYKELNYAADLIKREEEKKAEADKRAEAKYQKQREKALRDFETLTTRPKTVVTLADEFYYTLGWIVKHAGTISAILPDYLEGAFTKHFGPDTGCKIVNSKHRSPAGWQSQWSWSFKITLKKIDSVPSIIVPHLNPAGKAITNTSFVWDLIDDYGFQFGKKQDVDKIKQNVPTEYLDSFEAGLTA